MPQLPREEGKVAAHTQATNEQLPGGQPGSELFEPPGQALHGARRRGRDVVCPVAGRGLTSGLFCRYGTR